MNFRTEIEPLKQRGLISHADSILMMGSCFTTSVGSRLDADGFDVLVNPFGVLYNPASIELTLRRLASGRRFDASEAVFHDGLYHSFLSHSTLSAPDVDSFVRLHNEALDAATEFLGRCNTAIITLGTAWVFRLADSDEVVANCHKMPASTFSRRMLSVSQCRESVAEIVQILRTFNPAMRIIFTVSPIRHAADGAHGNMLSKSTLIVALEEATAGTSDCTYFPSFEIMLDDLRDYRFYAADMRHPSDVAVDYIYSVFCESFFDGATRSLAAEFNRLSRRVAHRPITTDADAALRFRETTAEMCREMAQKNPQLKKSIDKLLQLCHIV